MKRLIHHAGWAGLIGLTMLVLAAPASAQDAANGAAAPSEVHEVQFRGLNLVDWSMVAIYGLGMLLLGLWVARRQKSAKDYFLGGGNMGSFIIGISMFATLLSTISYLATPGEIMKRGPMILLGALGTPIAMIVATWFLIPALMKQRVTSAYELLQEKLGYGARAMAAIMFIGLRLMWMALMLHIASGALMTMLKLPEHVQFLEGIPFFERTQIWVVIITGIVAVGYTTLGGLRAVVITDVVQFFLLFGGAVLTVTLISIQMNGFSWFPTEWNTHWDTQPFFSLDPHVRMTAVGSILGGALWWICTAGSDQTMVQRYMATKDVRAAQRSFVINWLADLSVGVLLGLTGLALLGYFMAHGQDVAGVGELGDRIRQNADKMFPWYIANSLPHGIAGLVVAALFAAAMSSLDSGVNSVTAVVVTDFITPFRQQRPTERQELALARYMTLVIGTLIVALNAVMYKIQGNYIDLAYKTVNLIVTPLFSLFFMALFVRWATPFGGIWGALYGLTTVILIAFWNEITGLEQLSIQWIAPLGLIVSISAGALLSLLPTKGRHPGIVVAWSLVAALPLLEAIRSAIYMGIINARLSELPEVVQLLANP